MLKKLKNNCTYFLIFFSITNITPAQEHNFIFDININPNNSNYWWLNKNNYGVPQSDITFHSNWMLEKTKTSYQINIFAVKENGNKIYIGESFMKYNFSDNTFLKIGKYYRDFSNYLNDEISSGHMLISHNAQPLKKIGLVHSQSIKKNKKITFDFGIAHGFFSKDGYYKESPILHEKFIYINIKNANYEWSIGLAHNAMWGGAVPSRKFPITLDNFLKVLVAEDGYDEGGSHQNALGNHLGIWDFSFKKIEDKKILQLYYQHIFEDTSGLRLENLYDGLWGIELIDYIPNTNLLIEYLATTNSRKDSKYLADRYYNNYQYKLGWSYKNYTLGNPYIDHLSVNPNDVIHFGVEGLFRSNYYQLKLSRRTNISDNFHYKMTLGKKINNKFNLGVFLINNDENESLGFTFSTNLIVKK